MEFLSSLPAGVSQAFSGMPLHYNKAILNRILGGKFITYDFAFEPGYNNIFHNAHGLIRLMIEDKDPTGRKDINEDDPVEVEAILYDYRIRNAGIKFRKINAKNLADAEKKIVAWFTKNAEAMKAVKYN